MRRLVWILLPLLTQCSTDRRLYVGTLQPVAGTCDPAARATLTQRGSAVQFAPSSGVVVLAGSFGQDGQVAAGLTGMDANKRPYRLNFEGHAAGLVLNGEYTTPRCRYDVHLRAVD